MSSLVLMPTVNANEDTVTLVKWLVQTDTMVSVGDTICIVETTKASYDVEAEASGYIRQLIEAGQQVSVGKPIAAILDVVGEDYTKLLLPTGNDDVAQRRWTKKAELVAKRLGIDIEKLAQQYPNKLIGEADVVAANAPEESANDLFDDRYPSVRAQRILLIGGGAGGGAITLDSLSRSTRQRAVGIVDNNKSIHGKSVMGVPILGGNDMVEALWEKRAFDAAIVVITANIDERAKIFEDVSAKGIPFANVIDPTVDMRANVVLGVGNLIMAHGFFAAGVTIGNNNFFASQTSVEHHSRIGNHCTFGPRCTTSGAVTIGDRVKFGMGVLVEPYLQIGDRALIPSGAVVTSDIAANCVLQMQRAQHIKTRN